MPMENIETVEKCTFCKYWYAPTNSAISPRSPKINFGEYDAKCKKCLHCCDLGKKNGNFLKVIFRSKKGQVNRMWYT